MSDAPIMARYEGEVWLTVPSYPAYGVSSFGRVRRQTVTFGGGGSIRHPKGTLRQRALPTGHRQVTLSINNSQRTVLVHRLVAEAFLSPPEGCKDCVCHRDDNPGNNRPDNLFWGSRADNSADMVRKGRSVRGTSVKGAKLDEDRVKDIRHRIASGQSQREVAAQFGIAQSNVSLIAKRVTWRHVP